MSDLPCREPRVIHQQCHLPLDHEGDHDFAGFSPDAVQAAAWAIAEHRKGGWPDQAAAALAAAWAHDFGTPT